MKKIKLVLLVASLNGGGAERVMVNLANHISRDDFDITFIGFSLKGTYVKELPSDIATEDLKSDRVSKGTWKLIRKLKYLNPDIILSTGFASNMILLMSKFFIGNGIKVVVRESSIPTLNLNKSNKIYKFLYKFLYTKADLIICQSNAMKQDLHNNFFINDKLMKVIHNPVNLEQINQSRFKNDPNVIKTLEEDKVNILSIGRLSEEKNHRFLITSFNKYLKNNGQLQLYIIGQGPLKKDLEKYIQELHLQGQVHLIEFQANPYSWLNRADLFILPSVYEGMPNTLLEAIACEVPVIITDHPGGSAEIMHILNLEHRIIKSLDWSDWWYDKPSPEVLQMLKDNFHIDIIVKEYENQLRYLVEGSK